MVQLALVINYRFKRGAPLTCHVLGTSDCDVIPSYLLVHLHCCLRLMLVDCEQDLRISVYHAAAVVQRYLVARMLW